MQMKAGSKWQGQRLGGIDTPEATGTTDHQYVALKVFLLSEFSDGDTAANRQKVEEGLWQENQQAFELDIFLDESRFARAHSSVWFIAVSSGEEHYVVGREDVARFIQLHQAGYCFVCHNAFVDFHLIKRILECQGQSEAVESWWEIANQGRLRDIVLLDCLLRLAEKDQHQERELEEILEDRLAEYRLSHDIQKDCVEPFMSAFEETGRYRHHPNIHSMTPIPDNVNFASKEGRENVEGGAYFLGLCEVFCVRLVYSVMYQRAMKHMELHQNEMFTNAAQVYGPLSEVIQVKASIVLAEVRMNGMAMDVAGIIKMRRSLQARLQNASSKLLEHPEFSVLFHSQQSATGANKKNSNNTKKSQLGKKKQVSSGDESDEDDRAFERSENGEESEEEESNEQEQCVNDTKSEDDDEEDQVASTASMLMEALSPSRFPTTKPSVIKDRLQELLMKAQKEVQQEHSIPVALPKTAKTKRVTTSIKPWAKISELHPFVKLWVEMEQAAHHSSFMDHINADTVHPRYTVMVRNGRATACQPPIQQTPRAGGFRELFKASPGHVMVAVDYSYIELCTLAAVCEARFGFSVLADVIRSGVDPHCFTAAMFEGVSLEDFMSWKEETASASLKEKHTNLRQRAKAINFGIPGGLSSRGLKEYAKNAYGVTLNIREASHFRRRLIQEVYPELSYYLEDCELETLANALGCSPEDISQVFGLDRTPSLLVAVRNVVNGKHRRKKRAKDEEEEELSFWEQKVWNSLIHLCQRPQTLSVLMESDYCGNERLARTLFGRDVVTLTGRIRGQVSFTQACNTPFSGLAADGAKLAMWNLLQVGFRMVGFIHDEILLEVSETADWVNETKLIERIVCESMQEVVTTIPITCSISVSRMWSKKAVAVYDDEGRIQLWEDQPC